MSDRPGDKVIHPDIRAAEKPDSPDLHEARNAFADEFSMATRPRLGDGSMQRVNQANLDSQNQSIEIDFGGQVASRESGLTERRLPHVFWNNRFYIWLKKTLSIKTLPASLNISGMTRTNSMKMSQKPAVRC